MSAAARERIRALVDDNEPYNRIKATILKEYGPDAFAMHKDATRSLLALRDKDSTDEEIARPAREAQAYHARQEEELARQDAELLGFLQTGEVDADEDSSEPVLSPETQAMMAHSEALVEMASRPTTRRGGRRRRGRANRTRKARSRKSARTKKRRRPKRRATRRRDQRKSRLH
jgi:hypothetical protein